ncbi:DcaP family trimeric outer membrane transporter [Acinetobacter baumannii]|uniref:DcaP family trimeric outer membrane transporter n=1 Tax=Acinetobacter baumannii TaxID=470 RepID=UPI000F73BF8F|nr:DcaP family trimeric outer membrane transporter [Acinetobacter baumannii]RSQ42888.1 DcaP-like protein [Acinetobacter baumannii]
MKFNSPKTVLIVSLTTITTFTHANQSSELEQLRAEVKELRQMLQAQQAIPANSVQVPHVPTASAITPPEKNTQAIFKWQTKSGADVNLYGFVRADAAYQFEGAKGMFNRINGVLLEGDPDKKSTEDRLDSTVNASRIGLDFNTPVGEKTLKGKIEIDFRGGANKDNARLRHVYLHYDRWLIGQTTSTFLSTETAPEMLDSNTALGGGTNRNPMVRYSGPINASTSYFLSLEKGNDENRLPLLASKLKYEFATDKGVMTARGLVQEVRLRNENDETKTGWGAALGLRYKITPSLLFNSNYSHVSGDNKLLLATSDNVRHIQNGDDVELIDFDAFQLGLTYQFNEKLRGTIGHGALIYEDKDVITKDANKKLQQSWANLMFKPNKPLTFGVEYVYGERNTVSQQVGKDKRIEMMAKYEF